MRIPTLLQKIAELSEHPDRRTRIDVDLMLDYTRVLYADLLEWRDKLSAPAPNPVSAPIPATTRSSGPAPGPISTGSNQEPPRGVQSTAMPDNRFTPSRREPIAQPPVATVQKPSVEEKASEEKAPEIKEPTLAELAASMDRGEEEQPEKNYRPVRPQAAQAVASNLSIPAAAAKESAPAPVTAEKTTIIQKDIRSSISINEKYQIMSELFGNDKAAYENALDKINSAETETAAIKWLQDQLWVTEERSDAVQQFFDLVKRFKSQPEQGYLRF